jgi:hypothetical protein
METPESPAIYGLLAEFDDPNRLVAATHRAHEAGYRRMDAYSPFPIEEVYEAMGEPPTKLPLLVLIGGLLGGSGGFGLAYWVSVIAYPINVGGRPFNSWPAFIPITFECTILLAALTTVFGMLALNKLPEPYHPVFNAPNFSAASRNRFFLCIEAADPQFDLVTTREFLATMGPEEVSTVAE